MDIAMKNLKHYLLALLLLYQLSITTTTAKAEETVPAANIEQFVDVFKRIKDKIKKDLKNKKLLSSLFPSLVEQ